MLTTPECIIQKSRTIAKKKDEIMELIVTLCLELTELNIRRIQISQRDMDFLCANITTKIKLTLCHYIKIKRF